MTFEQSDPTYPQSLISQSMFLFISNFVIICVRLMSLARNSKICELSVLRLDDCVIVSDYVCV